MMNDRFASGLRQHLLDTANERPADGQLAAVVAAIGTTGQRLPVAARLTWMPGRIGPLPASALRLGLVALALLLAALGAALLGAGAGPRSTSFEGTWAVVDPADGSTMKLYVLAGQRPSVRYEDLYATGAACRLDVVKVFTADGTGQIDGSRLVVEFPNGGGCGLETVPLRGVYDYDTASDVLVDADHLVWRRVDQAPVIPAATPRPTDEAPIATDPRATEPPSSPQTPATDAPPPVDGEACLDVSSGGTYTAPADELILTATVPAGPEIPWQGDPTSFLLAGSCGRAADPTIHASTPGDLAVGACMPNDSEVTSFEDAIARLDVPKGEDIGDRVDLTIDGHRAARYDITNLETCDAFGLWSGTLLGPGETGSVYVIDLNGLLVAIELNRHGDLTRAQIEEAWAIVASIRFEAGG